MKRKTECTRSRLYWLQRYKGEVLLLKSNTKAVVALGGNALEDKSMPPTAESQLKVTERTAKHLAALSAAGYELALVHGNGPQVGRILLASETAADVTPPMPFDVCSAMSQGYIGYQLQQQLRQALEEQGSRIPVVTVLTQVEVDGEDPAFQRPTKPIGPFYTEVQAQQLQRERGWTMREDAGRGWRRMVASPKPQRIVELETIRRLWDSTITVACGGGGIPVMRTEDGELEGVSAVIDKDFAAECLAEGTDADVLLILTEVEHVCLHYGSPEQKQLGQVTPEELERYAEEGEFAEGSMLPKVQAAVRFVRSRPGRRAIITALDRAVDAMAGKTGTVVQ